MSMVLRTAICLAVALALVSAAAAGDQGEPEQACDGNTFQMVECLKGKTAQWDKRLNVAYQKALQDAQPGAARSVAGGAAAMGPVSRRQLPVLRNG